MTDVVQPTTPLGYGVADSSVNVAVTPSGRTPACPFPAQRIDEQVQLVDEIVREQRVHELTAAVGEDVLARLRLQRADRLDRRCRG